MDLENMKRKQLQALCKEHGIPANLTNLEMADKLSSLLKVNDEKPLTRGRSCLKMLDVNESDVVNRKVKKVKFSPDNEVIEFTRSAQVKRGGRRKIMLYKNNLDVRSDGVKVGILDSPVRVTRSQGVNIEDGVTEKKGTTRQVKYSAISVNKSKDEVGVTTKRTLKNKEVVIIQEKREENEGTNDGVRMSRRVRSRKNAKESVEDFQEEPKMDRSEKVIDREEKRDKKVTFVSGGHMDECTKSETKAKELKRVTRRKSMAHNQTLPVQIEVDTEVREEVAEKPARVTRSRNLKPVEDNVSNKRNRTRGKKAIETSEELLCTEFVESSVEAVKDEVRVITRGSRQNSVVEAPEKALKRSGRIANKDKGSRLSDDITKEKMVTRGRTRNQFSSTVVASTSESGTKIVESKGKHEVVLQLEEPVEVPPRRCDRRKSVLPLEKLRGDEVAAKKEKSNFLNANDDEVRQKVTEEEPEEPQKALKRSKRLATQVEDSVLAKDDIAENKIDIPTESQGTLEVVLQTGEVPIRSNRRKSVVPSLEKVRSDEVGVVKEKKTLNANDGDIGSKRTKEEPQKISKRSKRLANQMEDPVLAKHDIAENKLEERRLSRRNVANANLDTKILDRSVQEETSVVKEERRRSGRSASRHTLAAVSDDKKEKGGNKLTKRNCTVQDKDSTNKFTLQDLDSAKQSISSSKASVRASVVKKTSTAGKKQQGRLKRSNAEVEVLMPEDMEIVREPVNKDCNISGSGGTMSFSRSSLNELDAVPDDVNIVLAGTKDDTTAELSILADKLTEEGPLVDANSSPSANKSASKSLPFSDPFNSDARPEENLVEELLQVDHEEQPASKGLCPSSVLADDAVPNDLTFDKQEPGATVVDNVEEFVTGLYNDVFDNCSLSQSNNMGEIFDSGTKDDAAAESSPLADKLIEEGPLVDANASPSENNSISEPFSDSFNSNATPKENLVEELLQCDHEAPAGKDLCPSPILADDAVPNEITSDKQEHGSIAAHNAEGLSDEVLGNCSPSQSENMEENLDSGFKEQSETGCVVTEGVSHGEQEPASKVLCPGSALADDAVPNDIISNKQEHGTVEADNAEEVDTGSFNEVLDNMEQHFDAGLKEQSVTGCIVMEGVTYGEQEPESKGLCPSSVLADDAVQNDITSDKLEHGAIAADTAEEFDSGSSKEVLDNCSVNQSDNMEEKLDSGFKEPSETRCIVSVGVNYGAQELTATDYAKELDVGLSSNVLLDNLGSFNHSNEMEGKISEAEAESDLVEANYDLDAPTFTSQGEIHAEECGNLEVAASEKTVSSPIKAVLDLLEPGILGDGITLHVTPLEDSDEEKQGEDLKILFATPGYVSHSKEKKDFLDGDSRDEGLNREGQVSPISGNDTSSLQSSVRDCGEHGQGEYLKRLFATPFGSKCSKVDIATSSAINETSSQCQHSFHENEHITLHVTPSEDCDEEKQGEELKILFATPGYVSHSKEEKKASLDGDSRDEGLNREGQVSPISGNDTSSLQNSVRDCGEHGQGEYLKRLFATPFGGKSSKVDIATSIAINETSSQYQHSFHENENMGEDLKGLFATPSVVSQSVGDLHYLFQNQLSGEAMTTRGLGSSGKENLSESVRSLIENKQVEQVRTSFASPVSVKCTNQETTSTKGKCSPSHEMQSYICSGVERDLSESEAGSIGVNQAPETSHITAFNFGDENEQEDQLIMPFASANITQSTDQMDGIPRMAENNKLFMSGNVQGLSRNKVFPVAHPSAMDLEEPESIDSKHSEEQNKVEKIKETVEWMKESSAVEEENNEGQGNMLSATSAKSMTPFRKDELSSKKPKIKETAECMKESSTLEEENNEGQCNMLSGMSAKNMTPLRNNEFFSQDTKTADVATSGEMVGDTEMTTRHESCVQEIVDIEEQKIEETVADRDLLLFSPQEPKTADVAMSGEMVRDTEVNTIHEICFHEIVDIEEHKIEETVADRNLLLRGDVSRGLEEDIYVGIANESTSPVISEPTCNDIGFSEQQMVPEINQSSPNESASPISEPTYDDIEFSEQQMLTEIDKSSLGNINTSDAFNDGTEDHLRLQFATPIKEANLSRLGEASSCQLKTAMIAMTSEMAGKQPKQGFEFSGEPLTVEIISGGSDRTKRSHFSKEIEQFEGGPLFPTPSKGTRPLQFEESPGCEEDIFKYLDGVKLLNTWEQNFEQHGDRQFSNEITDDTGEATLHWFQTNDDNVPRQTELETQKEIDSAWLFEPLHEEGEVTEDDALAKGKEDNHPVPYQESIEDELINTDEAAKSGAVSDAVCQQPNILLTDIKTENITQESTRKTDGFSVSAESGILEFDAESTALRSQEPIIITVEETKGEEVQKLEVSNISNAFLENIPNDDEYAKNNSTVLPADEQIHFIEHYAIENASSTEGFTAFTNECQHVTKEDDLAAEGDRLVIFESNESTPTIVNNSGLTTQMDMPGIFTEEPQRVSDQEKSNAAKQQDEDSFDKKEHESTGAVLSPSSKSHESISFIEEGIAGEGTLIFEKKDELAEKKVALTPAAGVAKTSFAKHLNSTVKKKNARSILIHGTPNKLTQIADMKENAPNVKGDIGTLSALRPDKRPALKDLPRK
ncbi:uncharacterized protein LOC125850746 isoform X2 [Solanum stenotomum]|uniref:uncharacterized protein LOC125850746 isoform X2 n=1 Tax=Solanum stenotomum TaxID=172797 RepID=UPI0020D1C29D|nr:uncharacterized protein LOC125850746 isoform X2 [Solanum stenotomum]